MRNWHKVYKPAGGGEGGGEVSPRKSVVSVANKEKYRSDFLELEILRFLLS